jgi:hypothetical protein
MKSVSTNKLSAAAAVVGLALLVQGCSTFVLRPVSESNKDTSGSYDGRWSAKIVSTASSQHGSGGWTLSCPDRAGTDLGIISVANGTASIQAGPEDNTRAYVSESGKFRFEIPTEVIAAAAGTSDSSLGNGAITLIMNGSLNTGKGLFTVGIKEFSNSGCTSKVVYTKL